MLAGLVCFGLQIPGMQTGFTDRSADAFGLRAKRTTNRRCWQHNFAVRCLSGAQVRIIFFRLKPAVVNKEWTVKLQRHLKFQASWRGNFRIRKCCLGSFEHSTSVIDMALVIHDDLTESVLRQKRIALITFAVPVASPARQR